MFALLGNQAVCVRFGAGLRCCRSEVIFLINNVFCGREELLLADLLDEQEPKKKNTLMDRKKNEKV